MVSQLMDSNSTGNILMSKLLTEIIVFSAIIVALSLALECKNENMKLRAQLAQEIEK